MEYNPHQPQARLAWHETLDMHELVAFQANGLMTLKKSYRKVRDPELRKLYHFSIRSLSNNLKELTAFYPAAPQVHGEGEAKTEASAKKGDETGYYAGKLLGMAKTAVRSYSIAITETATPALHQVLLKQLVAAVHWHHMVFNFMYQRSMYPAHDLNRLLAGDLRQAHKALSMKY